MATLEELTAGKRITETADGAVLTVEHILKTIKDAVEARQLLPAFGSRFENTELLLDEREVEEMRVDDQQVDNRAVRVTLTYKSPDLAQEKEGEREDENDEEELDLSLQQEHIVKAISQRTFPAEADCGPFIGVTQDRVEGTEKFVPRATLTISKSIDGLSDAQAQFARNIIGTTNEESFRGNAKGEALLSGVNVRKRGRGKHLVRQTFFLERNVQVDVPLTQRDGDGKLIIENGQPKTANQSVEKGGWEYIWFGINHDVNDGVKKLILSPDSVNVAQIYEEGRFSNLPIDPT